MHIDKLDDIVNKYNNTYQYHSTIKMKPSDVKSDTCIESSKEINDKDSKFKVGDIAKVSKQQNVLQNFTLQIGRKKFLLLKKLKTLCPGYVTNNLNIKKKLLELFTNFLFGNCWKRIAKNKSKRV